MKNVCCIVNPVSGLKKSLKVYYEAKNHFEESNFNASLFISKYPNHIKDYISKIDNIINPIYYLEFQANMQRQDNM